LDIRRTPALPRVLGSSNFLARRLLTEPDWIDDLTGDIPAAPTEKPDPEWPSIRIAKYRGLLRITARDLVDRPFRESLHELSDLADRCLTAALFCTAQETALAPPALLALGKLGGRELNFSSDVDLLFVYRHRPECDVLEENHDAARVIRHLKTGLETPSVDGFAYRVDLDLRPEGRASARRPATHITSTGSAPGPGACSSTPSSTPTSFAATSKDAVSSSRPRASIRTRCWRTRAIASTAARSSPASPRSRAPEPTPPELPAQARPHTYIARRQPARTAA
jgi:hypothetical protein